MQENNNMLRPSINQIIKKGESPYSLVIAVAKRARDISDELFSKEQVLTEKPVKTAVLEFYEHKYKFVPVQK
jgi:DNA-directed RNA polymerase subunit omega